MYVDTPEAPHTHDQARVQWLSNRAVDLPRPDSPQLRVPWHVSVGDTSGTDEFENRAASVWA
jgi:hypothetical protein